MLYNFQTFLRKKDRLKGVHFGTVVDNEDPQRLGHVKVRIPEVLDGSTSDLPWIAPKLNSFLGGNNNAQSFAVPNEGAQVCVEFINPYCIYYTGWIPSSSTRGSYLTDTEYPSTYGQVDELNTGWRVVRKGSNDSQFELKHLESKVTLVCDKDGNVIIDNMEDFIVNAGGKIRLNAKGGNVEIEASRNVDVDAGSTVDIDGSIVDIDGAASASVHSAATTISSTGPTTVRGNPLNMN